MGVAAIFLLGLATVLMCVTGLYVWWRKRQRLPPNSVTIAHKGHFPRR